VLGWVQLRTGRIYIVLSQLETQFNFSGCP
jgi:hypothetical protein